MKLTDKDISRFEEKYIPVPECGCWIWLAGIDRNVSPKFSVRKQSHPAARIAYSIYREPIKKGFMVLRMCHNFFCVNPEHLFAGTKKQCAKILSSHGRYVSGEDSPRFGRPRNEGVKTSVSMANRGGGNGRAVLTEEDVIAIRKSSDSNEALAEQYNVSKNNIYYIRSRRSWKYL